MSEHENRVSNVGQMEKLRFIESESVRVSQQDHSNCLAHDTIRLYPYALLIYSADRRRYYRFADNELHIPPLLRLCHSERSIRLMTFFAAFIAADNDNANVLHLQRV